MRSWQSSFLALVLLCGICAFAQTSAPVTADTLWAGGDGKFEGTPDIAIVRFNVLVQQPDTKSAYAQAEQSAEAIRMTLRDNGIDPKDAEIGSFYLQPYYNSVPRRKPSGFQACSQITIKIRDFSKVGKVMESFSQSDKTDALAVNYALENTEAAKLKAVEDAIHRAHAVAEAAAHASGRSLGALSYASVDTNEPMPRPRPLMFSNKAKADAAPDVTEDFAPAKITVTAHVNALFQLK
jgi:hypothetical protein